MAAVVDTGVSPYALVAIPAQSVHIPHCVDSFAPEPAGSVSLQRTDRSVDTSAAPFIPFERFLRDQVIRGTPSIGCGAAEDADGNEHAPVDGRGLAHFLGTRRHPFEGAVEEDAEGDRFEEVPGMMTVQWLERRVQAVHAANEGQDADHECRHNDDRSGDVLEESRHCDAA